MRPYRLFYYGGAVTSIRKSKKVNTNGQPKVGRLAPVLRRQRHRMMTDIVIAVRVVFNIKITGRANHTGVSVHLE